MSVFTAVQEPELRTLLAELDLTLLGYRPASQGIENSNYLVDACHADGQRDDLVLTLFEHLSADTLPWYADVLTRLADQGLPVPCPRAHPRGTVFFLSGKPAMLVPRLPGAHILQPDTMHCRQIGTALARLHNVAINQSPLPDERSQLPHRLTLLPDGPERDRAGRLLARWLNSGGDRVLVHADLFRDNALFVGDQLSGLLDFYNACHDHPSYDLAVAINDWCVDGNGIPLPEQQAALLEGYLSERSLSSEDLDLLPIALAIAALRFWLSRLAGRHKTALEGSGSKDPEPFARLYRRRLSAIESAD